jgi:hypothetical protein
MADTRNNVLPVTLDAASLEIWGLQGSGRSVRLQGDVDDTWADSFALAQHIQGDGSRFYLDRRRHVLVFSAESGADPQKSLSTARVLIDLTNRHAGRQTPRKPVDSVSPDAEGNTRRATAPGTPVRPEAAKKSTHQRMEDTRGSKRVSASLMVQFRAASDNGTDGSSTGMTRDVTETGLFVVTSRLPSVGEKLSLTVYLEAQKRIALSGEVVRVLDKDEARHLQLRAGFAARVTDPSGQYSRHIAGLR